MKIFLIRHADAINYKTGTVTDDDYRFITYEGRKTTEKVTKAIKKEFKKLDKIFTSPLIRAVQTAEVIATSLRFKGEVEPVNELRNESSVISLQVLIKNNIALNEIALVSHEPKISMLVKVFSDKSSFTGFGKSSVCLIKFDVLKENGKFMWYFDSGKMEFEK